MKSNVKIYNFMGRVYAKTSTQKVFVEFGQDELFLHDADSGKCVDQIKRDRSVGNDLNAQCNTLINRNLI